MENIAMRKHRSYSSAEKARVLEEYKASGLRRKVWCRENGVGLSTLNRWLQQENQQVKSQSVQTWMSVMAATPEPSYALTIQIGKCTIPIQAKTDLKLLADVLSVVVQTC